MSENLKDTTPTEGVSLYMRYREDDLRKSSLATHRSSLSFFEEWCETESVTNLNNLTGRELYEYRQWRTYESSDKVDKLSKKSVKTQQDILRAFIKFCETIDAVQQGLHEKVQSPSLSKGEAVRDEIVDSEEVQRILTYLEKFEYASIDHVIIQLLAESGCRISAPHGSDKSDVNLEENYIQYEHRPESGTTLKNGDEGSRLVNLSENTCRILQDYLENQRKDQTDEYGREPLLTVGQGRLAKSTIRSYCYKWTRPCAIGLDCPHGRDPEECEASTTSTAYKCPSSKSPHCFRRGYITHLLTTDIDRSFVSGRCDVSEEIIREHYDKRSEKERMEVRQRALDSAHDSFGSYGGE